MKQKYTNPEVKYWKFIETLPMWVQKLLSFNYIADVASLGNS
jgi:hypothetical protein